MISAIETHEDDEIAARSRHLSGRILDGVAAILDELTPDARLASARGAIVDAAWAQCAPLVCRFTTCRRAQRCRRTPCAVSRSVARSHSGATRPR